MNGTEGGGTRYDQRFAPKTFTPVPDSYVGKQVKSEPFHLPFQSNAPSRYKRNDN